MISPLLLHNHKHTQLHSEQILGHATIFEVLQQVTKNSSTTLANLMTLTISEVRSLVLANDAEAVSRCMNPNYGGPLDVGLRLKNDLFAIEA